MTAPPAPTEAPTGDARLRAIASTAEELVSHDWTEVVAGALERLGAATAAERVSLIAVREDVPEPTGAAIVRRLEGWFADPADPLRDDPRMDAIDYAAIGLGRWVELLDQGEVVAGRVEEFPPAEQAALAAFGVRNLAAAPIHVEGRWWGVVSIERLRRDGAWDEADLDALRAMARLFGESIARHRTTERLDAQREELHRSNRELEQFAYVASHDLQEPLRMVTSFLQLLEKRYRGQLDDTADTYIEYAVDGARRMQGLINDLLAFSRVGTRELELQPTDLTATADRVLRDLGVRLEETGAVVEVGPLPRVLADPGQIRQVLQNLVTNALTFAEGAPRVRIAAEPAESGWWRITVTDEGIGIDPDHRDRIFDLFKRLHTRDEYPGTGLGLAICRKVVERHGGTIDVSANPEGGTVFAFTLPTAEELP